jgi:hypothetical protein
MKPFNLEAALRGEPVITRDGRPVKIAVYNEDASFGESVLGWLEGSSFSWARDGQYLLQDCESFDLFMAPTERKEWVVIWRDKYGNPEQAIVFDEKPKDLENAKCTIHEITIHD